MAALTSAVALAVATGATRRRPTIFRTARSASSCRRRPVPAWTCRRACSRRRWASSGASRGSWRIARAPTPSSEWKPSPRRAPDGYTLVYAPVSAVTTNAFIYKKLPYDPLRDFAPITQTVANPLGAGGQSRLRDQVDQGTGRAGQGESRPDQLRLVRHRQHDPPAGRAAVARRRHQDDARALSGADAGDHRHPEPDKFRSHSRPRPA